MQNNNKVYYPIAFAVVLIIGIIIGNTLGDNKQIIGQNNTGLTKLKNVLNYINKAYVDDINTDDITDKAISNVLAELDPHSSYIPASQMQAIAESMGGSFEGIGIRFQIIKDTIVVITPIEGGPSKSVGIKSGDRIIKVDTLQVAGNGITNEDVLRLLKGPKGTKVMVAIKRANIPEPINFTITRDKIPIHSVDIAYKVTDETGYIKINKFGRTTYNEFIAGVSDLKNLGIQNLIIDLRENPGGYLDIAIAMADELLPTDDLIVYTEGKSKGKKEYFAKKIGLAENLQVAVLINEGSASASEIIAGALQDNDKGTIIGRRSFGKGLVQEEMGFEDKSAVRLTTARYYTPSGRCIQKPYNLGEIEKYDAELSKRMQNGELANQDSIQFPDSLKFTTKNGRTVYAGGGIMPDIFVPIDVSKNTANIAYLLGTASLQDFAFNYADQKRNLSNFKNEQDFISDFDASTALKECVINVQNKNDVALELTPEETEFLTLFLKAQIARNLFGNQAYYPIMHKQDKVLQRALEEF